MLCMLITKNLKLNYFYLLRKFLKHPSKVKQLFQSVMPLLKVILSLNYHTLQFENCTLLGWFKNFRSKIRQVNKVQFKIKIYMCLMYQNTT